MSAIVFSSNIVPLGILDCFSSVIWDDNYWDTGTFEINCSLTEKAINLLKEKEDRIVWIKGKRTAGVIEKVVKKIDTNGESSLNVKGHLLDVLLNRRIVWGTMLWYKPNIPDVIKALLLLNVISPVNLNRQMPYFTTQGMNIRYIRDTLSGNSVNVGNHWVEIMASHNNSNIRQNATASADFIPATGTDRAELSSIFDDVITTTPFIECTNTSGSITIDLGSIKMCDIIQIWHYWGDGRQYNNKTEVSADGTNWVTIFDSSIQGKYTETGEGHKINLNDSGSYASVDLKSYQVTGEEILNEIIRLCQAYDYGFETLFDPKNKHFGFNLYRGVDHTESQNVNKHIIFSVSMDELLDGEYVYDSEAYKNTAWIAGQGEGTERKTTSIDTGLAGLNRREMFIDARDLSQQEDDGTNISNTDYLNMLISRGNNTLGENQAVETYEGKIKTVNSHYVYGKDFYKGDTVTLIDERMNVKVDAKITGVEETWSESEGYTISFIFGFQQPTLYSKLKRRNFL